MNCKPIPLLTITSKVSFSTGAPKRIFGEKTMYIAQTEDGQYMELYNRTAEYSDTTRALTEYPTLDIKITFNNFFPKTQLKYEVYVAIENVMAFLPIREQRVQNDKYSGGDEQSPMAGLNFPAPSFGLKFNF